MTNLKIKIDVDAEKALIAIKELVAELKDLGLVAQLFNGLNESAKTLTKTFDLLNNSAGGVNAEFEKILKSGNAINNNKASEGLNKIKNAANDTKRSLSSIKPGADQASSALTDVGRVAQDLPFGFIGIQNNLPPLFESFRRLKTETGSTAAALKAFGGALFGVGGLGFLLSAASAAFLIYQNGIAGFNRKNKEAKESVDEFSKTLSEVGNAVGSEAAKITTLINALQSGTLNTGQREKALKDLKKQNEEYFGSLKDEKGVIEGLTSAYDKYLENLDKIGRAKAVESQLTKLFDKKLELELSIDPKFLSVTSSDIQFQIGKLQEELKKAGGPVDFGKITGSTALNDTLSKRIRLQQQINTLEEEGVRTFVTPEVAAAKKQIEQLGLQIKGLSQIQKDLGQFNIIPDKPKRGSRDIDLDIKLKPSLPQRQSAIDAEKAIDDAINGIIKQVEGTDAARKGIVLKPLVTIRPEIQLTPEQLRLKELELAFQKTADRIRELLSTAISDSIGQIGESIGTSLATGDFSKGLEGFGQIIGGVISQIGKALIEYGVVKEGLDKILKGGIAIPGALAIGLGVAAIAIGSLIKNSFKQKAFAEGGIVTGPTNALIGERGAEVVFPLKELNRFLNGGLGAQPASQPQIFLKGEDFWIAYNKVNQRKGHY